MPVGAGRHDLQVVHNGFAERRQKGRGAVGYRLVAGVPDQRQRIPVRPHVDGFIRKSVLQQAPDRLEISLDGNGVHAARAGFRPDHQRRQAGGLRVYENFPDGDRHRVHDIRIADGYASYIGRAVQDHAPANTQFHRLWRIGEFAVLGGDGRSSSQR